MKCACRKEHWNAENSGDQSGKNVIVTGANSGIGYHTALELGRAGAHVIIACRDAVRGREALLGLQTAAPGASFRLESLDLSDLASVRLFACRYLASAEPLDVLVNNAGIMALPKRELSVDGFESQFATNHLGHFALTGLLLPALQRSASPRVVTVSSVVASWGKLEMDNLQGERLYRPMRTYGQSKLANLAFMMELGRRIPWLISVASHPGIAVTRLQKHTHGLAIKLIGQSAAKGALPTLRAAVDVTRSGLFYGPKGWFQLRGLPVEVRLPYRARNGQLNRTLWDESVRLTGVDYHL